MDQNARCPRCGIPSAFEYTSGAVYLSGHLVIFFAGKCEECEYIDKCEFERTTVRTIPLRKDVETEEDR
jgi:hypothetical protein